MESSALPLTDYYITRRRFIPNEVITLKNDIIHYVSPELITTSWDTLKPRADFSKGISAYYPERGCKVTAILNSDTSIKYWYCDIMDTQIIGNHIETVDMILDVIVREGGSYRILDCDELADCLSSGIITPEFASKSLWRLNRLLDTIYCNNFNELQAPVLDLYERMYNLR